MPTKKKRKPVKPVKPVLDTPGRQALLAWFAKYQADNPTKTATNAVVALAYTLDTSMQTIYLWVDGKSRPSRALATTIEERLGIAAEAWATDDERQERHTLPTAEGAHHRLAGAKGA